MQAAAEYLFVRIVTAAFYSELFLHPDCFGCAAGVHDPAQHSIFNSVPNNLLEFVFLSNVVHSGTLYLKAKNDFKTPSMSRLPIFGSSGSSS